MHKIEVHKNVTHVDGIGYLYDEENLEFVCVGGWDSPV